MKTRELLKSEIREIIKGIENPVIVEGKHDERALAPYCDVIVKMSGRSLYDLALYVSEKYGEVIVLTDFDKEGDSLAGKLNLLLVSLGVKVDTRTRARLKRQAIKLGIGQIEALGKALRDL